MAFGMRQESIARALLAAGLLFVGVWLTGCDCDGRVGLAPSDGGTPDPDAGWDAGTNDRDTGPRPDAGPDAGMEPCDGVFCSPGQTCDAATNMCRDRTCADCTTDERCEPSPDGVGVLCASNTCMDDVGCPEDRWCTIAGICAPDTCVPGVRECSPDGRVVECEANGSTTFTRFACFRTGGFDGRCTEEGGELFCPCQDDWDCPANTECAVDRCVGTGREPTCLLPPADIDSVLPGLEPGFPWGGTDRDVRATDSPFPESSQAVVTPIVINLDDDNGDGAVNELDVPEIVFMTFCNSISGGARFSQHGVLRAVHGGGPNRGEDFFATCDNTVWSKATPSTPRAAAAPTATSTRRALWLRGIWTGTVCPRSSSPPRTTLSRSSTTVASPSSRRRPTCSPAAINPSSWSTWTVEATRRSSAAAGPSASSATPPRASGASATAGSAPPPSRRARTARAPSAARPTSTSTG